jgi:hypothetical protein
MIDPNNNLIPVKLSTGASFPLRPIASPKTGSVYHAVLKVKDDGKLYDPGSFGQRVDASVVGGALPTSVTVAGTAVKGVTGKSSSGNDKVVFYAALKVNGVIRKLDLAISKLPNGDFNVAGHLTGGVAAKKANGARKGPATVL